MGINWTNVTNAGQLLALPNQNTGGWFWMAINLMIWIILILVFSGFHIEIALMVASFIALIISLFLTYMGLVAWEWCLFYAAWLIFTILYVVWSSSKEQA